MKRSDATEKLRCWLEVFTCDYVLDSSAEKLLDFIEEELKMNPPKIEEEAKGYDEGLAGSIVDNVCRWGPENGKK